MTYRTSIDIAAPVEKVWAVMMDVERWPEWTETMTEVERLESGMFRTGSSARVKQPKLPATIWRVTSMTPQAAFTWSSRSRGVTTVAKHVVTATDDGGTRAESSLQQSGPLAWMARLLFSRLTRSYVERESEGLKKRCEVG